MAVFHQLEGMLKSQFILIKRNKFLSLIEVFCPIFVLLCYFLLRLSFEKKIEEYKTKYSNDFEYLFQFSTNLTNKIISKDQIITSIDDLDKNSPLNYTGFLSKCKVNNHIAIIGQDFPEKILEKISSHFWEMDDELNHDDIFKKFETIKQFDNYITSKNYGTEGYPKICFGISKIDKFKFGIHYNTINVDNDEGNEVENYLLTESPYIPESKTNKNEKIKIQENLKFFEYYKSSGYLMVMKLISDYILQEITQNPDAEINYSVIAMIYDMIITDPFHKYLYLLGFFIIISYSIIFSINIYREIHFRETKKKEYLKSMGMKERVFFLSSFIRSFLFNIIHSLLGALMINLVLKQCQYIYLALILFLFGLVIFSMTYFFQSFLQESRKGVIISLLCFCIMSFFYLPINSPEINKSIIYLFCILFPPTNLLLGLNVFYIFEKEFVFFNDNIKLDVSQITVFQMILFLICSFFIYLFLGFIISQFFSYEFGVKKHFCSKKKKKSTNNEKIIYDLGGNIPIEDEEIQHKPNEDVDFLKKSIQIMTYELINIPQNSDAYNTKANNLKKSIQQLEQKNNINNTYKNNNVLKDELEFDYDDMKEKQKIRNKRRDIKNSMSSVLSNENFINKNLKISEIKNFIPNDESFMSKSLQDVLSENSIIAETDFKENEFNKMKDKINDGAKLVINNIKKCYKKEQYVLNGLSCTFYENEIFGLLGENGAGKSTFISILSGLIEATDGTIRYKINSKDLGADITTNDGIRIFRKTLGICPQNNNILFENLTVKENLEIFCLFKYDKNNHKNENVKKNIEKEVNDLLEKFDLKEKRNTLIEDLSGGQKRKLCIAIACCGRSKVIILDEPTGGIDILSRKNIWKILEKIKYEEKIILLITHFMDEASYLADKIGILRDGKLIVSGTNRDLIDKYGKYITLKINKRIEPKEAKNIVNLINKKYCINNISNNDSKRKNKKDKKLINEDGASSNNSEEDRRTNAEENQNNTIILINNDNKVQLETFKERIVIRIPTKIFDFSKSLELLEELENKQYKINSYSIIRDQLEDVFVNSIINNKIVETKIDYTLLSKLNEYTNKYSNIIKFKNDLIISFLKRIKDYKTIITEIVFPVILVLIACLVSYVEWLEDNTSNIIELNSFSNDVQTIFFEFKNISDFEQYYSILYSDASKEKEKLKNYSFKYLKNLASKENYSLLENLVAYMNTVDIYSKNQSITNNTASFYLISTNEYTHQYEFVSIISSKKRHSPITFTNYLLNNIIKYEIKHNSEYKEFLDDVGLINYPFHLTYEEKNNKKSRNGFVLVFFFSIALSLIPSNFIMPIIREKENKSKHLQLISGLSIFTYWLNNYIFEIIKFFFISLFSLLILYAFNFYEKYLITFFVLYGPALISFTYCISYFINSEGQGQTIILLINLLFGALGGSAILILRTNKELKNIAEIASYFLRLVPTFCICYGYNELLSKKLLYAIDNFKLDIEDIELFKKKYNDPEIVMNYIKVDFIYLALEIVIYTGLLILLENKNYLIWKLNCKNKKENINIGDKIDEEENYYNDDGGVNGIENKYNAKSSKEDFEKVKTDKKSKIVYPLEVYKIKKFYRNSINFFKFCKIRKGKQVLEELTFKVKNGECFGFIGANGAGKTTAFRCLCQETKPNSGLIKINQVNVFDYSKKNKFSIGYCPQFDTVFEHLTVEQNLEFYGQLKGVQQSYLNQICTAIMKKLDLYQFKDYECIKLSGGNKRKVSVGISIISHPNVIFMDEPSTGMDPYTRKLLLDLMHRAYLKSRSNNQKAVVLTTHSIEEIESLCDKIGILVNGKISKDGKGTINDVIQKHSNGVELNLSFKKPSSEYLKKKYGEQALKESSKGLKEVKKLLISIKKEEYYSFIKPDSLGRDIYKLLNTKKRKEKEKEKINNVTVFKWVTYIDYLYALTAKLKQYFTSVTCINLKSNDFILNVKNRKNKDNKNQNQCESFIFGIMESFKKELFIEEYSYSLTSLESIFLKYCDSSYDKDKEGNLTENNNESILHVEL